MVKATITPEEGEELKRLYGEYAAATASARSVLNVHGMDSIEFFEADASAGKLYRRIREILGSSHQHWMV